jgi:hypothetical protein
MMTRHQIVEALLRMYPAEWRREYGDELKDMLVARPLTPGIAVNVLWSAIRQRGRAAAPSTVLGLASMLVVLAGFVLTPASYGSMRIAVLKPTSMTFPTHVVTFMASEVYTALLILCGWWTRRRYHYSAQRCGMAAMRMSLIAGLPVMLAGALLAAGAIQLNLISSGGVQPLPFVVLLAPIARLPENWIWGAVGGWFGQRSLHKPIRA